MKESEVSSKDLNDTQLSHKTRGSAEKDFKEYYFVFKNRLESLILRAVRDDKGNSK